ncbi:MAG: hypothetical protein AAF483_07915 [Planctomycetota bacterium]
MSNFNNSNTKTPFKRLLVVGQISGLIAGIATVLLGSVFALPPDLARAISNPNAEVDPAEVEMHDRRIVRNNTALCAAVAGAVALGLISCAMSPFSPPKVVAAIFVGLLAGLAGGIAGTMLWQSLVDNQVWVAPGPDTSTPAAVSNAVIWLIIGISAGGLLCEQQRLTGSLAGGLGGSLGSILFVVLTTLVLASVRTDAPLPAQLDGSPWIVARVLWAALPIGLIAFLIAHANSDSAQKSTSDLTENTDEILPEQTQP